MTRMGKRWQWAIALGAAAAIAPWGGVAGAIAASEVQLAQAIQQQEAHQLFRQGIQQFNTGQFREALQSWEQSLALYRTIGDRQGEANALGNVGLAYRYLGQYERAIDFIRQSLDLAREIGDHQGEGASLGNLGLAYRSLGQYERAIDVYQQSLAIANKLNDHPSVVNALGNLGTVHRYLGQYEQAIDFHRQALTLSQEIRFRQGEANALGSLGSAYYFLGQYDQAISFQSRSLRISQETGNRHGQMASLGNLGATYYALKNYEQAIDFHQQSLDLAQIMGDQQGVADAFNNLGNSYSALGQQERAIAFYQQSLAVKRVMGDRQGIAHSLNNLGAAYSAINRLGDAELALRQSLEIFESIRQDLGVNDANRISFFEQQTGAYQRLQAVLAATDRADAALEIADRARARSLAEFLAANRPDAPTSLDLDGIRHAVRQQNATAIVYSDLGGTLFTWVIRPDGSITLRTEESPDTTLRNTMIQARDSATNLLLDGRGAAASELGPWSATVRTSVVDGDTDRFAPTAIAATGLGDAYQRLIAPIADLLPTEPGARLIIVPDRELGLIPWAALRDRVSDRRLIDRYTLTLAPSLQTLRETHRRRQSLPPGGPPLIVGNPAPMPNGLDPLPGAEREAIAIGQYQHVTPLIGAAATETAVKQTWQTARWLHFATHGDPTWIALSRDRANDGLLTIEEIFNSQLQAELVVMSACDTGRGAVTGEGIIGLARAFLKAGTPSVVATLWKVPDDATAFLMDIFYRELAAGASKAAALRTAQLETRAQPQYAHPRHWAAFVLIGEAN